MTSREESHIMIENGFTKSLGSSTAQIIKRCWKWPETLCNVSRRQTHARVRHKRSAADPLLYSQFRGGAAAPGRSPTPGQADGFFASFGRAENKGLVSGISRPPDDFRNGRHYRKMDSFPLRFFGRNLGEETYG